jgi:hypothetical protein
MKTVSEIEDAVRQLSQSELAAFREWFVELDSLAREPQVKSDMSASGLDALTNRASQDQGGDDRKTR